MDIVANTIICVNTVLFVILIVKYIASQKKPLRQSTSCQTTTDVLCRIVKRNTLPIVPKPDEYAEPLDMNVSDCFKRFDTLALKKICDMSSLDFSVMTFNVEKNINISTIMRTASLCGVDKFIIFGNKKIDGRGCVGVQNYVTIDKLSAITVDKKNKILNVTLFSDYMIANKMTPIFIEQHVDAISLDHVNWNNTLINIPDGWSPCFIFGCEATGIPKEILALTKEFDGSVVIYINQHGVTRSHNVSSTSAIVLSHFAHHIRTKRLDCYNLF